MLNEVHSFRKWKWVICKSSEQNQKQHLKKILYPDLNISKDLQEFWPKENEILDLNKAIYIISNALKKKQKIGIVGDYDVDGSSATGLLIAYFQKINLDFVFHIPNRFTEGYGVSPPIIKKLLDQGADIIITVDNGTTAFEAIEFAKSQGKIFIILDHHHLQKPIEIDAFVNPHRSKNQFDILCATGLVFIFLAELNKYLYKNKIINEKITMMDYIDVAALATVCDVMPLVDINRAFVAQGIKKINKNPRPVYRQILLDSLGNINEQTLGFKLGPCINAPGRMGQAINAVKSVYIENEQEAKNIASKLAYDNTERKNIQNTVLQEALEQIEKHQLHKNKSITVYGLWFEGVVGIIAGRLKDLYHKPICVLTKNQDNWKGSLRSVEGFHVGNMVHESIENHIVSLGGGHEMAGGLSMPEKNLNQFIEFFEESVKKSQIQPKTELVIHSIVSALHLDEFLKTLEEFSPFGAGNENPTILIPGLIVTRKKAIKKSFLINFINASMNITLDCWTQDLSIFDTLKINNKPYDIVCKIGKYGDKTTIDLIDFKEKRPKTPLSC